MNTDLRIGVDIGGTFTDVVARQDGAPARIMKLPTTRKDPSIAVIAALRRMAAEWGLPPGEVSRFVHGTTVATNAVLERNGACLGLITTRGFRDVIEIGRQMRHQMYDLALDPETPAFLAPGRFRREVRERIGANGEVIEALDEELLAAAADELVAAGAQAIAIVFLFSFLDDTHERRARDIIAARHPSIFISISSEVDRTLEREGHERRDQARRLFREFMNTHGVPIGAVADGYNGPSASWREEDGRQNAGVGMSGRIYDLILVEQPEKLASIAEATLEDALFESGRPVLKPRT